MARKFGIITNVAGLQCGITVNSVVRGIRWKSPRRGTKRVGLLT